MAGPNVRNEQVFREVLLKPNPNVRDVQIFREVLIKLTTGSQLTAFDTDAENQIPLLPFQGVQQDPAYDINLDFKVVTLISVPANMDDQIPQIQQAIQFFPDVDVTPYIRRQPRVWINIS